MILKRFRKKGQKNITDFSSDSIEEVNYRLQKAFSQITLEFADHLTSINQNTNEIQSNYESFCELDSKIEKLAERIDEISMFLGLSKRGRDYDIKPLTRREQEVFLVIYMLKEGCSITYSIIARRLALTEHLVQTYVSNMITKGIPVVKKYTNNIVNISLDPYFRALQAKENIAGIHRKISEELLGNKNLKNKIK